MNIQQYHTNQSLTFRTRPILWKILILCLLLSGCSQLTPEKFYRQAQQMGLKRNVIQAGEFPLVYYSRTYMQNTPRLHLYLGGDGFPWHGIMTPSDDPSPHNPLVLRLMQQDKTPNLYLGRPCYQGFANKAPCNYRLWTSARYSPEIINTLIVAIKKLVKTYHVQQLTLVGYSGGGTIATLVARHIPEVTTLVTIAGGLDTSAWTTHHGYSPLSESLNPALQPPLPAKILQVHMQGSRDINIPPDLSSRFLKQQTNIKLLKYPAADHTCCWQKYWPAVLKHIKKTTRNSTYNR